MKICRKCGESLPKENFCKDKNKKDGLSNRCRLCSSIENKKVYYSAIDQVSINKTNSSTKIAKHTVMLEKIKELNYTLVSGNYNNHYSKYILKCPVGHQIETDYKRFISGRKCKFCANNVQFSLDDIINRIREHNFTYISGEYKNAYSKLLVRCENNHINYMTWASINDNQGCMDCSGIKKKNIDHIREKLLDNDYVLLSTEYKNAHSKLEAICNNNHKILLTWHDFRKGHRCKICLKTSENNIIAEITKEGWKLIENEYIKFPNAMKWLCPNGHVVVKKWTQLSKAYFCAKCSAVKAEREIGKILDTRNIAHIYRSRKILGKNLELDIYIPDYKIAIEHCGLWYHSVNGRNKNFDPLYHYNKWKACENLGILLLTIFEDEWVHNRLEIEQKIKSYFDGSFILPDTDTFIHDRRYPVPFNLRNNFKITEEILPKFMLAKGTKRYPVESNISKLEIYDCGYDVYQRIYND